MKTNTTLKVPLATVILTIMLLSGRASGDPVSTYWMDHYGLTENDLVFDFDNDGYLTSSEFFFGTNPFDGRSALEPRMVNDQNQTLLQWETVDGIAYQIEESAGLETWDPMGGALLGTGETFEMEVNTNAPRGFYRFTPVLQDSDGDCLSDFEEIHYTNTDPNDSDSDDDGLSDGDEVKIYRTDPNFASPTGRGTIRGTVVNDEDSDPATRSHPGIGNWTVFLDKDLNGQLDPNEPSVNSAPDGTFVFEHLDPGYYRVCAALPAAWLQVFPETDSPFTADGFPDAVAEMVDSGNGALAMPYGINKQSEVERKLVLGLSQEPVDPSIILGQTPDTPYTPPIALWSDVDFMGIPQDGSITLEFTNEEIIDGPGIDLMVASLDQPAGEKGLIYVGRTLADMQLVGQFDEGGDLGIDLGVAGIAPPIHFVKVEALDNLGAVEGFDLVGMKAINFQPPPRGHYDVTLAGGDEVTGIDFGVRGVDRPPHVFVHSAQSQVLEGGDVTIKVTASDDLGIVSQSLRINGSPVSLNGDGEASYTTNYAGILYVEATAEDTGGQEAASQLQLLVLNVDGTLPDLSGLGVEGPDEEDAPHITILSPYVGEIVEGPNSIIGSITPVTTSVSNWCVEYASTSLVDPENLDAADPDYVMLGQGSGTVINQTLATFPGDTVAPDTYLIRIKATGGTTRYFGFVIAVGLEEVDIRPDIEITSPDMVSDVTYLTDIVGSITTRQTLREWRVECIPLAEVNLDNLGDNTPEYKEIASGTDPVTDNVLGTFDPTVLPNDTYLVRVTAWNTNGLGWTDGVILNVTGEAKIGNFALEFVDLEMPTAGIPLQVKRIYDSLNAGRKGDFGYGWRLDIQDADINETVPQTGSAFLATPFKVGTRVYLTTPDGKRVGFTFDVEAGASGFLGTAYSAKFEPDPGVMHTLEVPEGDTAFLSVAESGDVSLFFINVAFNPDTYILTDPQGVRYTYDQWEGLLEIEDLTGNKVLFSEDGIEHTAGPKIDFARDAEGRITSITCPGGRVWQYHYDANGDLTQVTYPNLETESFTYKTDPAHFLTDFDNRLGLISQKIEYDAEGRVSAITDAEGNRTEQEWNPAAFSGTITDARGHITTLEYDTLGNIIRQINPAGGGEMTWEFNDPNHPFLETSFTDANGHQTTYEYDAAGNLTKQTDPIAGYVTTWQYDANNNVTKVKFPQGNPVEIEYDFFGNPILYRLGSSTREYHFTYTSSGLPATYTDAEGGLTVLEYDGPWSSPTKITFADGGLERFEYNIVGSVTKSTDGAGAETRYEYDMLSRLVKMIDDAGNDSEMSYHTEDQLLTETDRLGRVTSYTYFDNGLVESVTYPDNTTTAFEYDKDGNRTAVIDPGNNRTEFVYDGNNRLIEEINPLGKSRTHTYDLAGNRVAMLDRNGRKRTFAFDALNRITTENWHDPSDDSILRTMTFKYDKLGRPTEVSDPDATVVFGWSVVPGSDLASERATYPGRSAVQVNMTYDNIDSLTRIGYTGSLNAARFVRDSVGRAAILKLDIGQTDAAKADRFFNGRGNVTSLQRYADISGSTSAGSSIHTIDPLGWANQISNLDAGGATLADGLHTFTRNDEGEITERGTGSETVRYGYDDDGQVTSADWTSLSATDETYQYDGNGNRTSSHRHASYTTGTGNRTNQAGDWTLDHDDEGNLIRKTHTVTGEVIEMTYDYRNRLTRVTKETAPGVGVIILGDYLYDALNRRIAVITPSETLWTYYSKVHPFVEYLDSDTVPFRTYLYADQYDELIAMHQQGEGTLWAVTDHLGTVHQWLDKSGNVVGTYQYDTFGNILTTTGIAQTLKLVPTFTGRPWDAETGLYYYRTRHYDPALGRFTSEDTIGFVGGDPNLYRYVQNKPLGFSDPTGMTSAVEYAVLITKEIGKSCKFAIPIHTLFQAIKNAVTNGGPAPTPQQMKNAISGAASMVPMPPSNAKGVGRTVVGQLAGKLPTPFGAIPPLYDCAEAAGQ